MGRVAVARPVAVGMLAMGALFVAPPANAAPGAPALDRPTEHTDYFSNTFVTGGKDVGASIEFQVDDGRVFTCASNPVLSRFECSIPAEAFWPRRIDDPTQEIVDVYAVDVLGARSPAAVLTVLLAESRLEITTDPVVPSGDVITLEGEREYSTTIEWQLESDSSGMVFQNKPCTLPADVEARVFTCTYDSTATAPRASRALAMVVPDGSYEATITEFQGTLIIDQISFLFTVGGTPPVTPPSPSDPPDPPAPPDPPDPPDPTELPTTPDAGGGGGGPGPTATPTTTPPATDPTTTPGAEPTPSAEPTPTADPTATSTPTLTPVEPDQDVAGTTAALPAVDILPWLILAVMVFTVLGTIGVPGLGLGGRFAPGSTRTGGGQVPVGRWPAEDTAAARTAATHRSGSAGLAGLAAGEVGAADEAVHVDDGRGEGWGDRSVSWRAPGHEPVDELSAMLPLRLAPRWPLLGRLVEDGSPVRAILGSLSLLVPIAGLVLGVAGGLEAGGPYAPTLALSVVLLAIGLTDAIAGVAAVVGFSAAVVLTGSLTAGDVTLGQGLRGLVGVTAIWFVVPLVAGAARPFRRFRAAGQVYAWDRAADTVIAALLSGWAVQGLVGSLDDLVGRAQPLTEHADLMGLLTVGLVVGRFGLEELAARAYPRRLGAVHRASAPVEPSFLVQLRGVVVRSAFLAFFAWAFIGSCWELWVGVAIFSLPYVLALVHERIPDARTLAVTVPRGIVETLVLVVVGGALAFWINADVGDDAGRAEALGGLRTGFVVLAIPAAAIGVLGVLGGEPPAQKWTWPRQLAGAAVVVVTLLLVIFWL